MGAVIGDGPNTELLTLMMKGRAKEPRAVGRVALRSWKSQVKRLSLEPLKGIQPCQSLEFSPVSPVLDF